MKKRITRSWACGSKDGLYLDKNLEKKIEKKSFILSNTIQFFYREMMSFFILLRKEINPFLNHDAYIYFLNSAAQTRKTSTFTEVSFAVVCGGF